MKQLLTTLLLLIATTATAQTIETNEVDEFTGVERIITSYEKLDQSDFSGKSQVAYIKMDGDYYISFLNLSYDSWQMLGADTAYFVIDGERKRYKLLQVQTEVESGYVYEQYVADIEIDDFYGAESIKARINGTVYTFESKALQLAELLVGVEL